MRYSSILIGIAFLVVASLSIAQTQAQLPPAPTPTLPSAPTSSTAEAVYTAARPKLIQIRTLVGAGGRQASIGSGFIVSADGLAITNFHVISQYALEPTTYWLEFVAPDGVRGGLQLLAFDVANDLALVRVETSGQPFFEFDARALSGKAPKGERLFSMGNPLDLGFTIVEGTYNGLVDRSYVERIHFSGAINPGMSGGPAVTSDGRVAGINVAKQWNGELVSFLVPARFAAALVSRAQEKKPLSPDDVRAEITRQLNIWQAGLYQALAAKGSRVAKHGSYQAMESSAPWFTCWAHTNAGALPKTRALVNLSRCANETYLFVADDLITGNVEISYSYVKSLDLNAFQFAAFLSQQVTLPLQKHWSQKRHTPQRCHEEFIAAPEGGKRPLLRATWCARAYREFDGIYDVAVVMVTQDRSDEALVTRIGMLGVSYPNAVALVKRFMGGVSWAK
jgi:serine protease Do